MKKIVVAVLMLCLLGVNSSSIQAEFENQEQLIMLENLYSGYYSKMEIEGHYYWQRLRLKDGVLLSYDLKHPLIYHHEAIISFPIRNQEINWAEIKSVTFKLNVSQCNDKTKRYECDFQTLDLQVSLLLTSNDHDKWQTCDERIGRVDLQAQPLIVGPKTESIPNLCILPDMKSILATWQMTKGPEKEYYLENSEFADMLKRYAADKDYITLKVIAWPTVGLINHKASDKKEIRNILIASHLSRYAPYQAPQLIISY